MRRRLPGRCCIHYTIWAFCTVQGQNIVDCARQNLRSGTQKGNADIVVNSWYLYVLVNEREEEKGKDSWSGREAVRKLRGVGAVEGEIEKGMVRHRLQWARQWDETLSSARESRVPAFFGLLRLTRDLTLPSSDISDQVSNHFKQKNEGRPKNILFLSSHFTLVFNRCNVIMKNLWVVLILQIAISGE